MPWKLLDLLIFNLALVWSGGMPLKCLLVPFLVLGFYISLICKMISSPCLLNVPITAAIIPSLSTFYLHKFLTKYYDFDSSNILILFHKYHNGILASHRKLTKHDPIFQIGFAQSYLLVFLIRPMEYCLLICTYFKIEFY